MLIDRRLLAIIGRRLPAIYDVIPRGPLTSHVNATHNPQSLPPHELGAEVAAEFVHTVWLSERFGLDVGRAFDELDDWCPTVPKRPKLPPWWPPIPMPDPPPEWFIDFHLGFAARLAAVSAEFDGTRLAETIDRAIERSEESIETAINEVKSRRSDGS